VFVKKLKFKKIDFKSAMNYLTLMSTKNVLSIVVLSVISEVIIIPFGGDAGL
jgi:hypothetical protein